MSGLKLGHFQGDIDLSSILNEPFQHTPYKNPSPRSQPETSSSSSSTSNPEKSRGTQQYNAKSSQHKNAIPLHHPSLVSHNQSHAIPLQHGNSIPFNQVRATQRHHDNTASHTQVRASTPPGSSTASTAKKRSSISHAQVRSSATPLFDGRLSPAWKHQRLNEQSSGTQIAQLSAAHGTSQSSHQVWPVHSDGDRTPRAAISPIRPSDSPNTTYSTFYELENSLHTEFTNRLRTYMYDGLRTELSDKLRTEVASNLFFQLYSEMYKRLSNEVLKKLSGELFMKISNELFDKLPDDLPTELINDLNTKLSKELTSYASGQLYHELFGKLHADIYNQLANPLANQMTDSTDDNYLAHDEDDDHHHQQEQQLPMSDEDEFTADVEVSPQPSLSLTITSTNGQLDIPLVIDRTQFTIRSSNVTPFALHIMLLGVLANNPDILVPLESLKECFFDHIHKLNEECFSKHHVPADCNSTVIKMVIGITCTRLRYAIDCLYPLSEEEIGTDSSERVILELEKGPHAILEDIIRDSLSVYNPMRILLSYLRSITTRYHASSITTPEEQEAFEKNVLGSDDWISELKHLCSLCGLYLWDSQWITDEEWDELTDHMNIFYTKIFTYVKDDFAIIKGYGDKQVDNHHCRVNRYFKTILRCIASCFAFRYRPMKNPAVLNVPYGEQPSVVIPEFDWVETKVYQHALHILPDVVKQCVTECMNNPPALMQSPLADPLLTDKYLLTTSDTKGHASVHDYVMAELETTWRATVIGWAPDGFQEHDSFRWTPLVFGYGRSQDPTSCMVYLINCIVKYPPKKDPVYKRIKDVFPKKVDLSNIITCYGPHPLSDDPKFTCRRS